MNGIINGKIKSITQPADSVIVCVIECKRQAYNSTTKQSETVWKLFPVKCFSYIKNKIAKEYIEGDFIKLEVELDSREYNGNVYYDLLARGLITSKEKAVSDDF